MGGGGVAQGRGRTAPGRRQALLDDPGQGQGGRHPADQQDLTGHDGLERVPGRGDDLLQVLLDHGGQLLTREVHKADGSLGLTVRRLLVVLHRRPLHGDVHGGLGGQLLAGVGHGRPQAGQALALHPGHTGPSRHHGEQRVVQPVTPQSGEPFGAHLVPARAEQVQGGAPGREVEHQRGSPGRPGVGRAVGTTVVVDQPVRGSVEVERLTCAALVVGLVRGLGDDGLPGEPVGQGADDRDGQDLDLGRRAQGLDRLGQDALGRPGLSLDPAVRDHQQQLHEADLVRVLGQAQHAGPERLLDEPGEQVGRPPRRTLLLVRRELAHREEAFHPAVDHPGGVPPGGDLRRHAAPHLPLRPHPGQGRRRGGHGPRVRGDTGRGGPDRVPTQVDGDP